MNDDSGRYGRALDAAPAWLARSGVRSWLVIGIVTMLALGAYVLSLSSAVVGPLLLATILGILFAPLVDVLAKWRVPRAAAAGLVMLLILTVSGGIVWLIINNVGSQMGLIIDQVTSGATRLLTWLQSQHIPINIVDRVTKTVESQAAKFSGSAASILFSGISSVAGIVFSGFISFYMLFFTLNDAHTLTDWIGRHLGLPDELGLAIVDDARASIRQYFEGTTVLALVTSAATGLGLALFHVPLVIPIVVVTFVLTYIPYLGPMVSGAFAVLIAFGYGGFPMALLALLVVLVVQNVLQGAIAGWAIGGALNLHPLVVIISTLLGATFGGLIGAMLGAPVAAILVRGSARLRGTPSDSAAPKAIPAAD